MSCNSVHYQCKAKRCVMFVGTLPFGFAFKNIVAVCPSNIAVFNSHRNLCCQISDGSRSWGCHLLIIGPAEIGHENKVFLRDRKRHTVHGVTCLGREGVSPSTSRLPPLATGLTGVHLPLPRYRYDCGIPFSPRS